MKLWLASFAISVVSPLVHAGGHQGSFESRVLLESREPSLSFDKGSFVALSRLDASGDARFKWNPADWNETTWDRVPDGDLRHVIEDDGWFDHCQIGPVPEVSSWILLACGAAAVVALRAGRARRA